MMQDIFMTPPKHASRFKAGMMVASDVKGTFLLTTLFDDMLTVSKYRSLPTRTAMTTRTNTPTTTTGT